VIHVLSDLFILRGVPVHIRSDNGSKFVAKAAREWIAAWAQQNGLTSSPAAHGRTATLQKGPFGWRNTKSLTIIARMVTARCGSPESV